MMSITKHPNSRIIAIAFSILLNSVVLSAGDDDRYVCFSLKAAARILTSKDISIPIELKYLGYITETIGIIIDSTTHGCILIGRQNPSLPKLQLDDFVVALRAVHIFGDAESPGVSIDPADSTRKSKNHVVTYFGGVQGTRFGKINYSADYLLKEFDLGLKPTGTPNVPSPWEQMQRRAKLEGNNPQQPKYSYKSRIWFYPGSVTLSMSQHSIVLYECKIAVGSQFISKGINPRLPLPTMLKNIKDEQQELATKLSVYYDEMARLHPVLEELRSVIKLYALAKEMNRLRVKPDMNYWVFNYAVSPDTTPSEVKLIRRGNVGFAYGFGSQGGVHMRALARRIQAGDPEALAEAALLARPSEDSLSWVFQIKLGSVQVDTTLEKTNLNKLFAQADYFLATQSYRQAVEKYSEILAIDESDPEIWTGRAEAWLDMKDYKKAIADCQRALQIDSSSALMWSMLGRVYYESQNFDQALVCLNKALRISPGLKETRLARATIYGKKQMLAQQQADLDAVAQQTPKSIEVLQARKEAYEARGQIDSVKVIDERVKELAKNNPPIKYDADKVGLNVGLGITNKFPSNLKDIGDNLWETNLSVGVQQDVGNLYYPATASLFGLGGQFAVVFALSNAVIINNRLRFDLSSPFELRSAVINASQFQIVRGPYNFLTGKTDDTCEEYSLKALGIGGGFNNAALGAYYLLLDGLWNRPTVLLNFNLLTSMRGEVFSTYWLSKSGGASILDDEKIQFGQDGSFFIAGVQSEFPVENVRLGLTGSFMPELSGERQITGLEGKLRFPIENSNWASGFGLAVQTVHFNGPAENRNDFRFSGELEMYDNSMAFGIGSSKSHRKTIKDDCFTHLGLSSASPPKLDFTGKYIFLAWNIKSNLLNYRKWFQ